MTDQLHAPSRSGEIAPGKRRDRASGDSGAALVLVLVFLLVVGLIVGALLTASRNDIANAANFKAARSVQYDASSAVDLGIQNIRYTPQFSTTLNASPPAPCWGSGTSIYNAADGNDMAVWCSTAWTPTSAATRVVTISACPKGVSAAVCAARPTLQAVATFNDYPGGLSAPTQGQCVVYCGSGFTLSSWVTYPVVPAVSSVLTSTGTTSGTISGGTPLTIQGTGFNGATTVNFVKEASAKPTGDNAILKATPTNVSSTSLTVSTPATTWSDSYSYFVTVTTPTGTSAYNVNGGVFTYVAGTPTLSSVTPANGNTTGGSSILIKGAGFLQGATVSLDPGSGASVIPATNVVVVASDTITAVTPPVTSTATYYVRVTTKIGTTAVNKPSGAFTYSILVPTVSSIGNSATPNVTSLTAGANTSITITGTGFTSDDTVSFQPEVNGTHSGSAVSASSNVTSSTSITATVPSGLSVKTTYFVIVSNSKGPSSDYPVFNLA